MEKFVNLSESGVVVFSLGTNVRSEFITVEKQLMFIKIFQQLPQYNFLWKFESISTQIKLPANVQIWPWIPQSDVLAHQNCKAIIAHGGALSTQEAIFHGIPLLIIPFVYDQIRVCYLLISLNCFKLKIKMSTLSLYTECTSIQMYWYR